MFAMKGQCGNGKKGRAGTEKREVCPRQKTSGSCQWRTLHLLFRVKRQNGEEQCSGTTLGQ